MSIRHVLCTLLLVGLLVGRPAEATTLLRADLTSLARGSDAVVHGVVHRVQSRWSGDGMRIVTDVEVEVTESLKGQPGGTVLITQPGGRVGDLGQVVSGLASFAPGEEVVLFLEKQGASAFRVSGMAQGKYQVQRGAGARSAMAVPASLGDAVVLDPQSREVSQSSAQPMTLEALKAAIRAALQEAK
ncbi:hypothetical protein DRW03_00795 [Corallococcus sp. H22C18031201]|uniref:hypothetical protein n=1 Tax=Citreicoccus inhibens TaxID=2849499 RepID=UPI000E709752|nr:hypothetical protein [Citreicoccus inhibens]MBU8898225.1 hypothetical protein [Citreicoccus inhibens]RJS26958.1 hypothetical protein DRW03_00795 [Corallococcus sp. H22C18031201]